MALLQSETFYIYDLAFLSIMLTDFFFRFIYLQQILCSSDRRPVSTVEWKKEIQTTTWETFPAVSTSS